VRVGIARALPAGDTWCRQEALLLQRDRSRNLNESPAYVHRGERPNLIICLRGIACLYLSRKTEKLTSLISGRYTTFNFFIIVGAHGERGVRAYNGGLGASAPAGSRVRAPGQKVRGEAPLKLKAF